MAASEADYEHWPDDGKYFTESATPAPGYDSNNGLQRHAYMPAIPASVKAKSPSPEKAPSVAFAPQPVYYSHGPAHQQPPQYYSYPPQAAEQAPGAPQVVYTPHPQYYTYAAPQAAPAPAPAPPPAAEPAPEPAVAPPANYHVYQPAYSVPPKEVSPGPPANTWLGRTKAQVEEDNMKIAKKEGVYEKRKMAPVGVSDDQIFWVVELDGSHTLRDMRYIQELNGTWKKDPRFEDTYYFLMEEEEKK